MSDRGKARFAVVITKETVEDWTVYISADSREEACEKADHIVSNCMFPEFEIVESEYHLDASPVDAWHKAEPTRHDDTQAMICLICLNPVEWTGIGRDDRRNRSGKSIPGPWIHSAVRARR